MQELGLELGHCGVGFGVGRITEEGKTRVTEPEGDGLDFAQSRFQPFVQVMSPYLLTVPIPLCPHSFHSVLWEPFLGSPTYDPVIFHSPPHLAFPSHMSCKS